MKKILFSFLFLFSWPGLGLGQFPVGVNAGMTAAESVENKAVVMASAFPAAVSLSQNHVLRLGFFYIEDAAFDGFLSGAGPDRPANQSEYFNHAVIVTANPTVTLEWTDVSRGQNINYRVRLGKNPVAQEMVADTTKTSQAFGPLEYLTWYYWQVDAVDDFGRLTESDVYVFSLAPQVFEAYCAPNPAPAGRSSFVFDMPGAGHAHIQIFTLPHMTPAFETNVDGLADGTNVYVFDGKDNAGRQLFNGAYMVKIRCFGGRGENSNRFKLLVVR